MNILRMRCPVWVSLVLIGAWLAPDSADAQTRQIAQFTPGGNRLRPLETETLPNQIASLPDVTAQLKVIQRRSQLMVTRSNVIRTAIADQRVVEIVQFSPNELAFIGMALGTTTVTLWFEDAVEPLIYLVETIRDPSVDEQRRIDYGKLEQKLADVFPNSKVYLIPLSRKIIVKGQARDPEEASRILSIVRGEIINQYGMLGGPQNAPGFVGAAGVGGIGGGDLGGFGRGLGGVDATGSYNAFDLASSYIVNMLTVPGENQIVLRVRIAELKRSNLRQLGVNFSFLLNDSHQFFSSVISGGATTITGIFDAGAINVLINALETNGTAKILAEPNLTVMSGHPASFLSGGEFAVPTIVGINGVGGQQTTFRGFGVSLVVVPTLQDRDVVRMQILPEFSEVNQSNSVNGIPGVNTRRVQTTVELREGQTIALAGLLSHQSSVQVTRIPLLGQIPIVGPLVFNSKSASQDESELLILVTPEIIRPMDPDEVPPVPGFEVTHPTDCELYWHAMTEGAPDRNVYQLAPLGRGSGVGIPVGYPNFNPGPGAGLYPGQPNPNGNNQAPLTNGSLQGSPYGGPQGSPPPIPPARRQGENPGISPNPQVVPNSGQTVPNSRPQPIGPPSARSAGHAPGPTLGGPATQASYNTTRPPRPARIPSSEQTEYRGSRY